MSPNPSVERNDGTGLQSLDLIFALCIHAIILAVALMLALWQRPLDFQPQSVQVSMISAEQLDQMINRARKPVEKPQAAPPRPEPPKPVAKPEIKPKPEKPPVLKMPEARPKASARAKPARDFDPFKPMESSSDVKSSAPKIDSKAAEVFSAHLSEQELNRYIAMIQDAVQRHWKVPTSGDVRDPLVEMVLNPDGSVNKVNILESSGNAAFDASLMRAIEAAAPFQVPVKEFEAFRNNRMRFRPMR